jgi:hypothetical protein
MLDDISNPVAFATASMDPGVVSGDRAAKSARPKAADHKKEQGRGMSSQSCARDGSLSAFQEIPHRNRSTSSTSKVSQRDRGRAHLAGPRECFVTSISDILLTFIQLSIGKNSRGIGTGK